MKKLFARENFILFEFNKKQRIQSLVTSLLLIVFFIFSSFTFFNMFYSFVDILGAFVSGSSDVAIMDILRSLPLFLSFFMSFWTVLLLQSAFKDYDNEKRLKHIFKKGIVVLCFASINTIYVIVMRIVGKYSSLVEGSPSYLYPLDSLLYSLLFVCIGVTSILYVKRYKEVLPYTVPPRVVAASKHKPVRFLYCFGLSFWTLIALFGFTGAWLTLCVYDFKNEYAFFGIATFLIYILSPILLGFWEFYFNELKEEKKKEFYLPVALFSLGISIVFMVLYFVSLKTNMDAPANAGFGMFPIAFTASANYGTLIVVVTPLIVSIIATIRAVISKLKK